MAELIPIARRQVRMPDGRMVPWDDFNAPDPRTVGSTENRNNFLYNCYTHPMGRFFQETIKNGLEKTIMKIHDWAIPRYDKNAYTFADPRIRHIVSFLKGAMSKHMDDNDTVRKHALFGGFIDITGFMCKEDIFYRARIMKGMADLAQFYLDNPEVFQLTPEEQYNYDKFNGMGKVSCKGQPMATYPSFENWQKDPATVERWKAIHRPNGRGPT